MRHLTKSLFKLAFECPSKLYFIGKPEYADNKVTDTFLQALAEGGFQVGGLARMYEEAGILIETMDPEMAIAQTDGLLAREESILFEAAFQFENLFIRTDIVRKKGNRLDLIEVKAKSFEPGKDSFLNKKGGLMSEWKPYLFELAFQAYVVQKAYPELMVNPYLMLADKTAIASVEGLNQLFSLEKFGNRTRVIIAPGTTKESLGNPLLTRQDASAAVQSIFDGKQDMAPFDEFKKMVDFFSEHYIQNLRLPAALGAKCGKCEFKASPEQLALGIKSGFKECWIEMAGFCESDFERPAVLGLWNIKRDEYIQRKQYFLDQVTAAQLQPANPSKNQNTKTGLTRLDRQLLQIEKASTCDSSPYIDRDGLKQIMDKCIYPLHFIDFETTTVAIPFNRGRRPYEQIAFQFSHHRVDEDGTISHAGQWLNTEPGRFPNYGFVRALKRELDQDEGTIFRYANHENNILNAIWKQLMGSTEPDKQELCAWIQTITHSSGSSAIQWTAGSRDMVDMLDWVLRFYYHPLMKGSNSIKSVLPAILADSPYLQDKYGQPVYGTAMSSLNFTGHTWINYDASGNFINPYKTLPPIHEGLDNESLDMLGLDDTMGIMDGGAAMTAYARMQFTQMPDAERQRIQNSLLKYCELDTLAMAMIWEGWEEGVA